jgi:hypothetical protein
LPEYPEERLDKKKEELYHWDKVMHALNDINVGNVTTGEWTKEVMMRAWKWRLSCVGLLVGALLLARMLISLCVVSKQVSE